MVVNGRRLRGPKWPRRLAWRRKPVEELVNQEAIDVDMRKVLQNPRQYANKKLRFKGRIASSFEYAEILDAEGNRLGIWPERENALSQFFYESRQNKPPKAQGSIHGPRQSELTEYLGFLEWGGYFGHLGSWQTQFTIVEEYPAAAAPAEKAQIKQAYLKSLVVTTAAAPIPDVDETHQVRDAQQSLRGVWKVVRRIESGNNVQVDDAPRWAFFDNQVVRDLPWQRFWGTFRVDASRNPPRIDVTWNNDEFRDIAGIGFQLGIYRLDGNTLLIRWADMNGGRPADFAVEHSEHPNYIEFIRDWNAALPIPDPNDTAKDDPRTVNELLLARRWLSETIRAA